MTSSTLETTDIFRRAFYLCYGGHLEDIRFNGNVFRGHHTYFDV